MGYIGDEDRGGVAQWPRNPCDNNKIRTWSLHLWFVSLLAGFHKSLHRPNGLTLQQANMIPQRKWPQESRWQGGVILASREVGELCRRERCIHVGHRREWSGVREPRSSLQGGQGKNMARVGWVDTGEKQRRFGASEPGKELRGLEQEQGCSRWDWPA